MRFPRAISEHVVETLARHHGRSHDDAIIKYSAGVRSSTKLKRCASVGHAAEHSAPLAHSLHLILHTPANQEKERDVLARLQYVSRPSESEEEEHG